MFDQKQTKTHTVNKVQDRFDIFIIYIDIAILSLLFSHVHHVVKIRYCGSPCSSTTTKLRSSITRFRFDYSAYLKEMLPRRASLSARHYLAKTAIWQSSQQSVCMDQHLSSLKLGPCSHTESPKTESHKQSQTIVFPHNAPRHTRH